MFPRSPAHEASPLSIVIVCLGDKTRWNTCLPSEIWGKESEQDIRSRSDTAGIEIRLNDYLLTPQHPQLPDHGQPGSYCGPEVGIWEAALLDCERITGYPEVIPLAW